MLKAEDRVREDQRGHKVNSIILTQTAVTRGWQRPCLTIPTQKLAARAPEWRRSCQEGQTEVGSSRVGLPSILPPGWIWKIRRNWKFFLEMGSISQWNWHPKVGSSQSCLQLPTHTLKMKFGSVQSLSCVQLFATPWTATHQASLSITNSWSLLKLLSIEKMMPSNQLHLKWSLCVKLVQHSALSFRWRAIAGKPTHRLPMRGSGPPPVNVRRQARVSRPSKRTGKKETAQRHRLKEMLRMFLLSCYESSSFATLQTVARQAPLSTGFPKQEYWNGLPFSSPGDLSTPGIEPGSPALAGGLLITSTL